MTEKLPIISNCILNIMHKEILTKEQIKLFRREFNEKMFRAQFAYFRDIDYSEKVIYMNGFAVPDSRIKKSLIDFSLS